nr:immunoglobulin heavy chain junction region [Mus musculus]MBK4197725.1 immunoglobulin heavy chain junction region [Mus musculus]
CARYYDNYAMDFW